MVSPFLLAATASLLLAGGLEPEAPSPRAPSPPDTLPVPRSVHEEPGVPPGEPVTERGRYRVGVTLGGTNMVGVTFEVRSGGWAGEATLGSITLRDLSLSITGKRYFSGRTFRPYMGLGVWALGARSEEGSGGALILRAPAGMDWMFVQRHSVGGELSLNRAVWVRRQDPEDQDPPRTSLIPIPSLYYRFGTVR